MPTDPASATAVAGIAERAASLLETTLRGDKPTIVAIGTGRAMRAAVEQIPPMDCPDHQLVSLVGNISTDGSASHLLRHRRAPRRPDESPALSDAIAGPDVVGGGTRPDAEDRPGHEVHALAAKADLRLIGIGQMDKNAQFLVDGFISREELLELMRLGAVGEVTGWAFDTAGRFIDGSANLRLPGLPHPSPAAMLTVGAALGPAKTPAILAALRGRLVNGLITDEATAKALLAR